MDTFDKIKKLEDEKNKLYLKLSRIIRKDEDSCLEVAIDKNQGKVKIKISEAMSFVYNSITISLEEWGKIKLSIEDIIKEELFQEEK